MARIYISKPWQKITINLINYAMTMLLALTLAYWFWVFFKPLPMPKVVVLEAPTQTILPSILAAHWFNQAQRATVAADNTNLKLLGVFSTTHSNPGFAIFKLANGKQTHALLNHEVLPGTHLVAITKNSVTISQNGVEYKVMLEENKNTASKPSEETNTDGFNLPIFRDRK